MQDPSYQNPSSPISSRGFVLPPISKYYHGPAPGRDSPQKATDHNSGNKTASSTRISTHIAPVQPQSPTTYNARQWMNHFASQEQASWQQQGPSPSAPPANNVPISSYNPNTYGLMPGAHQPPHSGWSANSSPGLPPDTRVWGVQYKRQHDQSYGEDQGPKPPLPPRPQGSHQSAHHSQHPSYSSGHSYEPPDPTQPQQINYGHQFSPTFEQPNDTNVPTSPAPPSRVPPAPPPRPPEYAMQFQSNQTTQQYNQPYSSALPDQYLHASHSDYNRPSQNLPFNSEYSDQFSNRPESFDTNAGHPSSSATVSVRPASEENPTYQPSQHDNEQSVSPVNESDRWRPPTRQDGNAPSFFPSPMPEHATLVSPPGGQQRDTMSNAAAQDWGQQMQEKVTEAQTALSQARPTENAKKPMVAHDREDSFYWHSDQSSAQPSRSTSGNAPMVPALARDSIPPPLPPLPASEEVHRRDSDTLSGIPSLAHSPMPAYGASALGFGGPSDWEHFGDYDAEDIDDTDLYAKVKSPTTGQVQELPAEISPTDRGQSSGLPTKRETIPDSFKPPSPPKPTHNEAIVVVSEPIVSTENHVVQQGPAVQDGPLIPHQPNSIAQQAASVQAPVVAAQRQSQGTEPLSASSPTNRGSGISISDFPLPYKGKSKSPPERKASIAASDPSPSDPLGKNLQHSIEAWTQLSPLDRTSDCQRAEPNKAEKPKALNISPRAASSTANVPKEQMTFRAPHKSNKQKTDAEFDTAAGDQQRKLEVSQPHPPQIQNGGDVTSSQAMGGVESTSPRSKGKSSDAKLDVPIDMTPNRAVSSKRNSIIDVRSSDHTFDDLDPWAIASLNRYIAMLREESKAESNEAKMKIFTVFTTRESRLRAVLYEAEEKKEQGEVSTTKPESVTRSNTLTDKHAAKALPALPPNASEQNGADAFTLSRAGSLAGTRHGSKQGSVSLSKVETVAQARSGKDEEVKDADDVQYSPGGRPMVERPPRTSIIGEPRAPNGKGNATEDGEKTSEEPAYKPFKYEQGRAEVKAYAANRLSKRNSQYRPYAQLTSDPEPPIPVDAEVMATRQEARKEMKRVASTATIKDRPLPPALITAPKSKYRVNGIPDPTNASETPTAKQADGVEPDLRQFINADFDPLTAVLPHDDIRNETLGKMLDLQSIIILVPDDFSFIHDSVVAWDAKARRRREVYERERHARQVESEQHIDALFDDHDIGYGDISELESEFKRNEADRKANEDRAEYQTFVSEVFDMVWTRLHFEIDQLGPHYKRFTELLGSTTAGQDMFVDRPDNLPLAPTMDALLTLHQKLEIRHQKAFEAVLERDRRLKKTEISPWYTSGNVAKVKQLERQFETGEKQAIVDYCSQRDARANSLMDVIDQNTLRGVGTNQDYMEMIMKAVRRIASGRAFASTAGATQPEVGLPQVHKAQAVTKALTMSSEQIVQTFHVADMLLNAADYEVSVAKSRQSGADRATLERLKEERAKEDQKLMKDLQHRLALIREDSRKTHDEIVKLLVFLGAQGGQGANESAMNPLPDPSHQERLQKALEEAKRRNERANGVG